MKTLAKTQNQIAINILKEAGFVEVDNSILERETPENTQRWFLNYEERLIEQGINVATSVYFPRETPDDIRGIFLFEDADLDGNTFSRPNFREELLHEILAAYREFSK